MIKPFDQTVIKGDETDAYETANLQIQFRKSVHQRASENTEGGVAVANQAKLPRAASGQFFFNRIPERI